MATEAEKLAFYKTVVARAAERPAPVLTVADYEALFACRTVEEFSALINALSDPNRNTPH